MIAENRRLSLPPIQPYPGMAEDLAILKRVANRFRWVGWLFIFFFGITFIPILFWAMWNGFGPQAVFVVIIVLIFGTMLAGVVVFYFALASYIQRGRRWAIIIALIFASFLLSGVILNFVNSPSAPMAWQLFRAMMLIANLNLFKNLIQGLAISRRLEELLHSARLEEALGPRPAFDD